MSDPRVKPPTGEPAIRVVMMPRDANANGTIFGGVLMSYIDQAGFVECQRQSNRRYVTIAMDKVEFHKPVFVGDIVGFFAETTRVGSTSITVHVTVKCVHRHGAGSCKDLLTEADLVYVAIDEEYNPVPILD